jgi:hypothetical protein
MGGRSDGPVTRHAPHPSLPKMRRAARASHDRIPRSRCVAVLPLRRHEIFVADARAAGEVGAASLIDNKEYKKVMDDTRGSLGTRARTDLDAYLAGFFDGEGHVCVRRHNKHRWSFYIDLGVTQVDIRPLELFVKAYGGYIMKKSKVKQLRQCHVWKCSKMSEAAWALYRMLPWLIVKREKARVALMVLQYRPLKAVGGQISEYQKASITKALQGIHIIEVGRNDEGKTEIVPRMSVL